MSSKHEVTVVLVVACLAMCGCVSRSSGPLVTPREFIAANPEIDSRAALIRGTDPAVSRPQAEAQAAAAYASSPEGVAAGREKKDKAAQKAFEERLAKTLAAEGK